MVSLFIDVMDILGIQVPHDQLVGRAKEVDYQRIWNKSRKAAVSTLQVLGFMLVACSLVAVGNGSCSRYPSSSCDFNQVCCQHQCITGSDCNNLYCQDNNDCSNGETCCSNQCKSGYDCNGFSCNLNSDCSDFEYCCDGFCDVDSCDDPTPVIIGSVCGMLIKLRL